MKKLLVLMLLTLSASAMAQHHSHGFRHGHGFGHGHGHWARGHSGAWIIYEATRQPVVVQPNPVIIQQQTLPLPQANPTCTPWTEVQSSDGTITRTRTCTQ